MCASLPPSPSVSSILGRRWEDPQKGDISFSTVGSSEGSSSSLVPPFVSFQVHPFSSIINFSSRFPQHSRFKSYMFVVHPPLSIEVSSIAKLTTIRPEHHTLYPGRGRVTPGFFPVHTLVFRDSCSGHAAVFQLGYPSLHQ